MSNESAPHHQESTNLDVLLFGGIIYSCVRSFVLSRGGGVGSGYGPDPSKANMMMLKIPNGQVGLVIGKQGATIRGIQDRTGVNIQIPQV